MTDTEVEVYEPPKRGTLAWLEAQPTVEWQGLALPDVHKIPDGAQLYDGQDDGRCRVIRPDGRRCKASRVRRYGICIVHLGGGDVQAASLAGHAAKAKLRERRQVLGIGSARAANPRQIARLAAHERAEELAAALVHGPLDDRNLGSLERQRAVIAALDATFPLAQTTVEVELPVNAEGVQELGWQDMQALASKLLEDG